MNPGENYTAIRWFFDVHILDSPSANALRRMNDEGWIYIQSFRHLIVEINDRQDVKARETLLDAAAHFPIAMGGPNGL